MHTQWTKTQMQNHTLSQEITEERQGPLCTEAHTHTHALTADTQAMNYTHTHLTIRLSVLCVQAACTTSIIGVMVTRSVTELFTNLPGSPT